MNHELIKRIDKERAADYTPQWVVDILADCKAEIERLSKPYVPMTDDEFYKIYCELYPDLIGPPERIFWQQDRLVETAVIARYNEQRGVK